MFPLARGPVAAGRRRATEMKTTLLRAGPLAALLLLVLPAAALAADGPTLEDSVSSVNTMWALVAGVLVMFMQAGFAFLEIGFSRAKNAGLGVAKILTNYSICALAYWAIGFALAFGGAGWFAGTHGAFINTLDGAKFPAMAFSTATVPAKWFFQFVFCATSLAIVWGTTLERIKFGVYMIYAVVFSAVIYPVVSHWIFGGGWLAANFGMQDFAGSTVVHLIGATGAFAALLLLGPRQGKYGRDGKPNVIPGHSMPLVGLCVLILFLGWFGFNPGSTLSAANGRFAEVAGLVAITAPSGYVEYWAAIPVGLVAGVLVVVCVIAIDRKLDDPIGALSSHGVCGIWGTLTCGLFTSPRLASYNAVGKPGLVYTRSVHQLAAQALGIVAAFTSVFAVSFLVFFAIKAVHGLRVR